jgi:hypothetical protein
MKESVLKKARDMKAVNEISLKGEIVIFGSTEMAKFPFYELASKCRLENAVYNRSIEGMTVAEAGELLQDCVVALRPAKVFLALGEEDEGDPLAIGRYNAIVDQLHTALPRAELYLISLDGESEFAKRFNQNISEREERRIHVLRFARVNGSYLLQCKAKFKQLCCFFRRRSLSEADAFAMADL